MIRKHVGKQFESIEMLVLFVPEERPLDVLIYVQVL